MPCIESFQSRICHENSRNTTGKVSPLPNLKYFRQFYLTYRERNPRIGHAVRDQSPDTDIRELKRGMTSNHFESDLTWTHYRMLLKVENELARLFYEIESTKNRWSSRQLERQINSLLFERLSKSRDKKGVLRLANEGQSIDKPVDAIKDPYDVARPQNRQAVPW